MPSNAIDSLIFKDMYGTDELRAVFSDEQLVQCWLDYEAALARAEAAVGLVPQEAAAEISRKARVELIDFDALRQGIYETTHELVPLIWQLASLCEGAAGGYVHWGATTQDVTDTGLVMQVKAAYAIVCATCVRWPRRWPIWPAASVIRSCRVAPMANMLCRSPSDSRLRSGWPRSAGTSSAWSRLRRVCWWASLPARPGRSHRSASRGWRSSVC